MSDPSIAREVLREVAGNLSKVDWNWGCVSAVDSRGRTIWIVDAHRGDGKRFVVRADEKLTAFVELESAIRAFRRPLSCLRRILTLGRAWFDLYVRAK